MSPCYQERPGGPIHRWGPGHNEGHYDCWRTYSYPDRVVLAIDDERQRLANANNRAQTERERLRVVLRMQGDRIQELETSIREEQERTNALREQVL